MSFILTKSGKFNRWLNRGFKTRGKGEIYPKYKTSAGYSPHINIMITDATMYLI